MDYRRLPLIAFAFLASLFLPVQTSFASATPKPESGEANTPCPGAHQWMEKHVDQTLEAIATRDSKRSLSQPELLIELRRRADLDQLVRRNLLASPSSTEKQREVAKVDANNLSWLLSLLQKNGLPRAEQIGEDGLRRLWLLVQHADAMPQLQSIALGEFLKRHAAGEFSGDLLAKLTDRVLLKQGRQQRYGTQFDWTSGRFDPKGVIDPLETDRQRKELGLMPLADYACMMNTEILPALAGSAPNHDLPNQTQNGHITALKNAWQ